MVCNGGWKPPFRPVGHLDRAVIELNDAVQIMVHEEVDQSANNFFSAASPPRRTKPSCMSLCSMVQGNIGANPVGDKFTLIQNQCIVKGPPMFL